MEGFPYVIGLPKVPRIAFGSTIRRSKLDRDRHMVCKSQDFLSVSGVNLKSSSKILTTVHSKITKKYPSIYGHSAFASKAPRIADITLKQFVDVGKYDVTPKKPIKQNYRPFNSASPLKKEPKFATPGPPTYPYHEKRPDYKCCHGFGKKRRIWPATAIFCSANNTAKCQSCHLKPFGDYLYNFQTKLSLCRRCFKKQYLTVTRCETDAAVRILKMRELKEFQPVRYCDFYHSHASEKVAMTLMTQRDLHKKINIENYLYLYQPLWYRSYVLKDLDRKLLKRVD